mmetsp:Transcript_76879/g.238130  ORF Transcript_76879/g.238130 Transcript_76879/m.238130 type:complete len:213 (-) Transcript_76879:716-1354(-)
MVLLGRAYAPNACTMWTMRLSTTTPHACCHECPAKQKQRPQDENVVGSVNAEKATRTAQATRAWLYMRQAVMDGTLLLQGGVPLLRGGVLEAFVIHLPASLAPPSAAAPSAEATGADAATCACRDPLRIPCIPRVPARPAPQTDAAANSTTCSTTATALLRRSVETEAHTNMLLRLRDVATGMASPRRIPGPILGRDEAERHATPAELQAEC